MVRRSHSLVIGTLLLVIPSLYRIKRIYYNNITTVCKESCMLGELQNNLPKPMLTEWPNIGWTLGSLKAFNN